MKMNKDIVKNIAIAVLALISVCSVIALSIISHNKEANAISAVEYRPASEVLVENGFYPGRVYGDYTDLCFSFDAYLKSIGAEKVQRYMYTTGESKSYELWFELNGMKWKLKTTEFKPDLYSYGLHSCIEVENGKVTFVAPSENSGTYVSDSTSPFKIDWVIFDVFHAATNPNSKYVQELRAGFDEDNCPFGGLGLPHYEIEPDAAMTWHDDTGEFTIADGFDLHY